MSLRPLLHDTASAVLNGWGRQRYHSHLRVLMFHGLTDIDHPGLENCQHKHLHVARFERLISHLAAHYNVLSMDEVADMLQEGQKLPPYPTVLTFDDGFASNYHLAFPILRRYGLPAIIYLATEFVDEKIPIWVDRVDYCMHKAGKSKAELVKLKHRLKSMPHVEVLTAVGRLEEETGHRLARTDSPDLPAIYQALNWEQVREMAGSGLISYGSHTHSHVILGRAAPDVIRHELSESRIRIERETGCSCHHFCYPNGAAGDFSDTSEHILREMGFRSSILASGGFNCIPSPPYLLNRLGMTNDLRPVQFEQYFSLGDPSFRGLFQSFFHR